jgi:chitinase
VVVVPKDPLTKGSHYDVSVSVTYAGAMAPTVTSWSFTAQSLPEVSIGNASVVEGNARTRYLRMNVSLSRQSPVPVTVQYATVPGTATAPSDFSAKAGTITLLPTTISNTITIPITGDQTLEPNETFTVHLSNPQNATILRATGSAQIRTDDKAGAPTNAPRLSIGNASIVEGDSTTRQLRFSVSLSTTTNVPVKVDYATSDGPAPAADSGDYIAKSGTMTIPAGQTSAVLPIKVKADFTVEPTERFTLKLSNPVGASIQFGTATGSIHDDD